MQYKCRNIQAIGTSSQLTGRKLCVGVAGDVVRRVASAVVGKTAGRVVGAMIGTIWDFIQTVC